jgi:hypothetical protein
VRRALALQHKRLADFRTAALCRRYLVRGMLAIIAGRRGRRGADRPTIPTSIFAALYRAARSIGEPKQPHLRRDGPAFVELGDDLHCRPGTGGGRRLTAKVMVRPLSSTARITASSEADWETVVPTHDPATNMMNSGPLSLRPTLP